MIYVDTNIVIALCVREPDSDKVEAALAGNTEALIVSEWTRVEFTSAIGIKVRTKELSTALARRALADYHGAFEPGANVVTPSQDDYILATAYLQDLSSGLRSGDALHLAIAANQNASRLWTLDKTFIRSARNINVPVVLPW